MEFTNNHVQDDQATKLASDNKMKYFKTSALKGEGVFDALEDIIN